MKWSDNKKEVKWSKKEEEVNQVLVDFNKLLGNLNEEQAFRLPEGKSIRSLAELADSLSSMDENIFSSHVNNQKNDFASWIKYCFEDELLSRRISSQSSKESIIQEINTRIEQAKKTLESVSEETQQNLQQSQPSIVEQSAQQQQQIKEQVREETESPISQTDKPSEVSEVPKAEIQKTKEIIASGLDDSLDQDLDEELDLDLGIGSTLPPVTDGYNPLESSNPPDVPKQEPVQFSQSQELDADLDDGLDADLDAGIDEGLDTGLEPALIPSHHIQKPVTEIIDNSIPKQGEIDDALDSDLITEPTNIENKTVIADSPTQEVQKPEETIKHDQEVQSIQSPIAEVNMLGEINLSDEEKRLLQTPNEELSPPKLFKKLKLEKKLKQFKQVTAASPELNAGQEEISQEPIESISLTDAEKVLLKTPNEELSPPKLFKKLKLEKKLKSSKQQTSQATQATQISKLSPDIGLSDEEKKLLQTPNEELNAAQLFKKFKIEKKLKEKTRSEEPGIQQIKDILVEEAILEESPINILELSDDEFHKLIDINLEEDYVAEVSRKNVVKIKKKKNLLTGVPGFDDLMTKGIVEGSSILVSGGPGSGKTTFCIQQLGWAAEHGEKCLFLSLEESEERLVEHMKSYGLNPEKYLEEGTLKINKLDSFKLSRSVEALLAHAKGELMIDINPIMDIIPEGFKPDRIVLDSLSSIAAAFAGQPEVYRIYVEQLFILFEKFDATSFIITEIQGSESQGHGGVEDFIADGVINFYNIKKGMKRQPAMEILKMRGVNYTKKVVPFSFIPGKGIEIYPLEEVFYD